MKKISEKLSFKKISNILKTCFAFLVGLALLYSFAFKPVMDKSNRIACHANNIIEAQQFGQQIMEQNKDNEELGEEEIAAQVNGLITQRYELNYQLCLRAHGL